MQILPRTPKMDDKLLGLLVFFGVVIATIIVSKIIGYFMRVNDDEATYENVEMQLKLLNDVEKKIKSPRYCEFCGVLQEPESTFCPYCGNELRAS